MVGRPCVHKAKPRLMISMLCALLLYPMMRPAQSQETPAPLPVVSLTTSTSFQGDLNALIENEQTDLTFRVDLDVPAPMDGLRIFVDSNVEQMVNRLDLPGFVFNPRLEHINPASIRTSFDNSGFAFTLNEGAIFGTFTITVFDNPEPDTFLPETFDGLVEAVFSLKLQDDVQPQDALDIRNISAYTTAPHACATVVLFADDASQLPLPGPRSYDEAIAGDISGDMANPLLLPLSEGANLLSATSMAGDVEYVMVVIPEGFQLESIVLQDYHALTDGIAFAAVQNGCVFTEPSQNTNVANLLGYSHFGPTSPVPVGSDLLEAMGRGESAIGFAEALPSGMYAFWLQQTGEEASDYTLAFHVQEAVLRVTDNDSESTNNDAIASAQALGLDAVYPNVVVEGALTARAGDINHAVEATQDVDIFAFTLAAAETVALDLDSVPFMLEGIPQAMSGELRVFDAAGQALAHNGVGAAPGEAPSNDAYLEFTAPAPGVYYVGVSQYLNDIYDPNVVGSGNGVQSIQEGISPGPYTLELTVLPTP